MKKVVFFDVDGTLTRSKSKITDEMSKLLANFAAVYHVVLISGSAREQMIKQVGEVAFPMLAQSGNDARDWDGNQLWRNDLTVNQKYRILNWLNGFNCSRGIWNFENDTVEDRGCQISFSFVGHNAPIEEKEKFDPDKRIRTFIIKNLLKDSLKSYNVEAKAGGTTCLDFYDSKCSKGANVKHYLEYKGFTAKKAVYVGDALMPGGNDESVIGIVDTVAVKSPEDTARWMNQMLLE